MIAAEGEQKASRALKEAAAVINESPSALQVSFAFFCDNDDDDEDYDDEDDNAYDDIMIQYLESTASIFANVELDLGGKELNHHFPLSHGSLQVIVIIKLIIVFPDFNIFPFIH